MYNITIHYEDLNQLVDKGDCRRSSKTRVGVRHMIVSLSASLILIVTVLILEVSKKCLNLSTPKEIPEKIPVL